MAFTPGHRAWVALDNVAGTPVNVTAYIDNLSWPQSVAQLDTSTFGDAARDFIPGLTDGDTITYSGPADVALGTFIAGLKAAQAAGSSTSTVTFGPGGSVAGQIKISAETYVASYQVSTGVSGRAELSASLQVTGAVTNGTW
jgi:hypothetical protein